MSTIADLIIKVRADTGSAEKDISSLGGKIQKGLGKAVLPAAAALGVMGVVGKAAFDNLEQGANNAKQTEAVIKSTGDASNVTAKHVDDLAMSLRHKSGVDDDVIHSGENMLLTFTNIRNEAGKGNDIFDQSTKTLLDMSKALGQDTKDSAIQLGKALNDPIKGVTALQRVGVTFTDAQRKQIKAMVESGHTMAAQKLILHELNREFGGSAEHIDPTTKALNNLKLDATDLASSLVAGLLPALQGLVGFLSNATRLMTEHATATKIVVGAIAALSIAVLAINAAMKLYAAGTLIVKAATAAWTAVQWLLNAALDANPIGLIIIALAALAAALVVAWTHSETFRNIVTGAWNAIKSTAVAVVNAVKGAVLTAWHAIETATTAVVEFLKTHWREGIVALAGIVAGPLGALVALIATHWNTVKAQASAAWHAVETTITGAVNRVKSAVSAAFGALTSIVNGAVKGVSAGAHALEAALNPIVGVLHAIESAAQSALSAVNDLVHAAGSVGGIAGKIGGALGHIPGFATGVQNFRGGLAVVGENGPELVNLPGGSDVFTNSQSRRMLSGGGGASVVIENMHVRSDEDVRLWARDVAARLVA